MPAGLGHEVPEVAHHLEADAILFVPHRIVQRLTQARVEILPPVGMVAQVQEPCLMVDPRHLVGQFGVVHPDKLCQAFGRPLNAMAEADVPDAGQHLADRPHDHGHRVDIVQPQGMRADLLHLTPDLEKRGHGTQVPEDAPHADGVGDGLVQAVRLRDRHIGPVGFVRVADGEGGDDVVGAFEGSLAVGGDGQARTNTEVTDHPGGEGTDQVKTPLINVHQRDIAIGKFGPRQHVGDQASGEGGTTGAKEGDAGTSGVGHEYFLRWHDAERTSHCMRHRC